MDKHKIELTGPCENLAPAHAAAKLQGGLQHYVEIPRRGLCPECGCIAAAFDPAWRIKMTPTTRNQINGGKLAMMEGPQPPAL